MTVATLPMTLDLAIALLATHPSRDRAARALVPEHACLRDEDAVLAAWQREARAHHDVEDTGREWDRTYDRERAARALLEALWTWQREHEPEATVEPTEAVRIAGMRAKLERACEALAGLPVASPTVQAAVSAPYWADAVALILECGGHNNGFTAHAIVRGVRVSLVLVAAPVQPDHAAVGAALVADAGALGDAS